MMKLIATDLDNTLLTTKKEITPYTIDVLRQCLAKGICVVFATARPARTLSAFAGGFAPDGLVLDNGAGVMCGREEIHRDSIDTATLAALIDSLKREPAIATISIEAGHGVYTNYNGPPWGGGWNEIHMPYEAMTYEAVAAFDSTKVTVESGNMAVVQAILKRFPALHMYGNTGEPWAQIMNRTATKANGLLALCTHWGISLAEVVAFGDDENDIDMLRICGRGVAVANAIDECKAAANEVCGGLDEDGVARWIAENILAG